MVQQRSVEIVGSAFSRGSKRESVDPLPIRGNSPIRSMCIAVMQKLAKGAKPLVVFVDCILVFCSRRVFNALAEFSATSLAYYWFLVQR